MPPDQVITSALYGVMVCILVCLVLNWVMDMETQFKIMIGLFFTFKYTFHVHLSNPTRPQHRLRISVLVDFRLANCLRRCHYFVLLGHYDVDDVLFAYDILRRFPPRVGR